MAVHVFLCGHGLAIDIDRTGSEVDGASAIPYGHIARREVPVYEALTVTGAIGNVELIGTGLIVSGLISKEDISAAGSIFITRSVTHGGVVLSGGVVVEGLITRSGVPNAGGVSKKSPITHGSVFLASGIIF